MAERIEDEDTGWFSCRIRFAVYATGDAPLRFQSSAFLLRARDFDDARAKALQRGRREERTYPNADGGLCRTAMVEVETVDLLEELADGVEVACLWSDDVLPCPYPLDHDFHPERSRPGQSL